MRAEILSLLVLIMSFTKGMDEIQSRSGRFPHLPRSRIRGAENQKPRSGEAREGRVRNKRGVVVVDCVLLFILSFSCSLRAALLPSKHEKHGGKCCQQGVKTKQKQKWKKNFFFWVGQNCNGNVMFCFLPLSRNNPATRTWRFGAPQKEIMSMRSECSSSNLSVLMNSSALRLRTTVHCLRLFVSAWF